MMAHYGKAGGPEGDRTLDLHIANVALSQLSYRPVPNFKEPAAQLGEPLRRTSSSVATLPRATELPAHIPVLKRKT